MAKIRVELDVPDGDRCMTDDECCNWILASGRCMIFRQLVSNNDSPPVSMKCKQCLSETVEEKEE